MSWPLYLAKEHEYKLNKSSVNPRAGVDDSEKRKNLLLIPGFEPHIVQTVA
jgi:hypothetical protein